MKRISLVTLFSSLLLVFSVVGGGTHLAFAHDSAADALEEGTEEAMLHFLLHTKEHWEQLRDPDEYSEFRGDLRTDDGVWKSGDIYIILINQKLTGFMELKAGEAVRFHARHPASADGSLRHIPIFEQLMERVEGAGGEPVCLPDNRRSDGRYICAVYFTYQQTGLTDNFVLVAGFDHEENEVIFDKRQCQLENGYFTAMGTDLNGEQFTRTRADMVTDRESLVNYMKTVEEHITTQAKKIQNLLPPGLSPQQRLGGTLSGLVRLRPCWREEGGPWKSGEIYFYWMRYSGKQFGVFNGLNAELKNATLRLYDGCINVGQRIFGALGQEGVTEDFLIYYWSDPTKPDDVVVDDSGNSIRGLSTGTSVKLGYFLETDLGGFFPSNHVLGSGIYLDEEYYVPEGGMCEDIPDDLSLFARGYLDEFPDFTDFMEPEQPEQPEPPKQQEDDGGCAIASADEGNFKAAGFSFFLIAAVMFFGVFAEKRLSGKLRTWKF